VEEVEREAELLGWLKPTRTELRDTALRYDIRGLKVLDDRNQASSARDTAQLGWQLLCRCGTRLLFAADVTTALDTGKQRIFA